MSEVDVSRIKLALEEHGVHVDNYLLRRIEWSLGLGNREWQEKRLLSKLSDFVLGQGSTPVSLHDFLCDNRISLRDFARLEQKLRVQTGPFSIVNTTTLKGLDSDSRSIHYGKSHTAPEALLATLKDLELSGAQCKAILGIGERTYDKIQRRAKEIDKDDVARRGRSENDAWSFAKHVISDMCLRHFREQYDRSLIVLETHQGIGDASFYYKAYGDIIGFEASQSAHDLVLERTRAAGVHRNIQDLLLGRDVADKGDKHQTHVFVTEQPLTCEKGLKLLHAQTFLADAVDVDPFGSSQDIFEEILQVLADPSFLMLTVADQYPFPKREADAWERYGAESFSELLPVETKKQWRQAWMFLRLVAAWYMRKASFRSICLLPVMVLRSFEPWAPHSDFESAIFGVDRIYYVGKRVSDIDRLNKCLNEWTEPLPIIGKPALRTHIASRGKEANPLSFVSFYSTLWPAMKPYWNCYHSWLLGTAKDPQQRWLQPMPMDVSKSLEQLKKAIAGSCSDDLKNGFALAQGYLNTL